jgi:branched-chain amino acid transport system ATP-binding protein
MLALDEVSINFGGLRAVDDLSFGVEKGQIFGLIGPNGAGKTTVFNMITGVYRPSEGRIVFEGRDITGAQPHKVAQLGILRTFQTIRLFKGLSVAENVLAGEHLRSKQTWLEGLLGTPAQRREERTLRERATEILAQLNLSHIAHEEATSLPYGLQRRVELARTLAAEPGLLILDEPAAGLNDRESAELNQTILGLRDRGITILLVEHDMNVVMNVTDTIVVINFGQKIAEGPPEAIRSNSEVIEAYLGQDDEEL